MCNHFFKTNPREFALTKRIRLLSLLVRGLAILIFVVALSWALTGSVLAAVNVDFEQCQNYVNKKNLGYCEWVGGILNSTHSKYSEGMGTFQRLIFDNIASGTSHKIDLQYQFSNQNAIKGYDFLISWAQASTLHTYYQGVAPTLNQCADLSTGLATECNNLVGGSAYYLDLEVINDPYVSAAGDGAVQTRIDAFETSWGNRTIRLYSECPFSGTPTMTLSHLDPDTGDSDVLYTINYTTTSGTGCASGVSETVMLQFAGHLAISGTSSIAWGTGKGASNISGGGWHIRNIEFDDVGGSVDNQIQNILPLSAPPLAANLVSFQARAVEKGVRVKWETGSELDVLGFNVWRKAGTGAWQKVNAKVIDAKNVGTVSGAAYAYLDKSAKAGTAYRYKLEILNVSGESEWSKVVKVK